MHASLLMIDKDKMACTKPVAAGLPDVNREKFDNLTATVRVWKAAAVVLLNEQCTPGTS